MSLPTCIDPDALIAACTGDDNSGFCVKCGAEHLGVEPDARGLPCDCCETDSVYGAEELLIMFGA